jgi:hypothetical protein
VRQQLRLGLGARLAASALERLELFAEPLERPRAAELVAAGLVEVAADHEAAARLALADPHLLDVQALLDDAVAALARERGAVLGPWPTEGGPTMIITDQAAYSDQIFGLFWLLGYQFSPRPAGLPDQRFWRLDRHADYGPLDRLARHRANPT